MRETKYNQNSYNRKAPIDRDALWNKINTDPKFPKNTRKKRWFFGSLFLLGATLVVTYIYSGVLNADHTSLYSSEKIIIEKTDKTNTDHTLSTTQIHTNSTITNTPKKNLITKSTSNAIGDQTKLTNSRKSVNQKAPIIIEQTDTNSKVNFQNKESNSLPPRTSDTGIHSTIDKNSVNGKVFYNSTKNNAIHDDSSLNKVLKENNTAENSIPDLTTNQEKFRPMISPLINLTIEKTENLIGQKRKEHNLTININPVNKKQGLFAYANISYGISLQSLSQNDSTAIIEPINPIEDYLENRESRSLEIGIKKQFKNRYSIGLSFEYREDWQLYKQTISDTLFVDIVNQQEETTRLVNQTTTFNLHQNYTSYNILLTGGYLIPMRFGLLELGGGISYNINHSARGNVLNSSGIIISKSQLYETTGFGLSGFGQAGLTFPIANKLRMSINGRYDLPTNISANPGNYEHTLSAVRFGISLAYKLTP